VLTGNGKIGASFREVPSVALPKVEKIKKRLEVMGLGGILMIGKPGRPLLEIPVSEGRVGMIVAGGLNPLAAVEESGISTKNVAMKALFEFECLIPFWELNSAVRKV
jgi:repressor of nif and glnA expression